MKSCASRFNVNLEVIDGSLQTSNNNKHKKNSSRSNKINVLYLKLNFANIDDIDIYLINVINGK